MDEFSHDYVDVEKTINLLSKVQSVGLMACSAFCFAGGMWAIKDWSKDSIGLAMPLD